MVGEYWMSDHFPAIDVSENSLRQRGQILDVLLIDRSLTTSRKTHNIRWATDSYVDQYHGNKRHRNPYSPASEIRRELITGEHNLLIQPRAAKSREEQVKRTKDRAEVFTPLNVVKQMNGDVARNLNLPPDHNWQDFVSARWLEITCGEGPFIASRYNPVSNSRQIIKPDNRVGFLDRKLQVVNKHCDTIEDWLHYAEVALKSCYGYEFQGDSLLIARENVLMTMNDFYKVKFEHDINLESQAEADGGLSTAQLEYFAEIISWNIFQMDGLNYTIPLTGEPAKSGSTNNLDTTLDKNQISLFNLSSVTKKTKRTAAKKSPKYVKIMDWQKNRTLRFRKAVCWMISDIIYLCLEK